MLFRERHETRSGSRGATCRIAQGVSRKSEALAKPCPRGYCPEGYSTSDYGRDQDSTLGEASYEMTFDVPSKSSVQQLNG